MALGWLWSALLMLALGCYRITGAIVWRDELVSVSVAHRPLPVLWHLLAHRDSASGLYYLLLHAWIGLFGDSVVALRLPSVLAMAAAAAFVAAAGSRLYGPGAGLAAGLIFACLPVTSRYAQETRSYALCVAGAAAAGWLLLRAAERPGWRRWAGYTVAMAVTGLAHVVALALVVGHAVVVGVWWWRDRDRRILLGWLAATAAAVALVGPVLWLGTGQHGGQARWLTVPGPGALRQLWPPLAGSFLVAGGLIALAALAVAGRWRPAVFCLCGVLVPVGVVFAVSQVYPVWYPRYLLFVLPCLAIVAASAAARWPPRAAVAIVAVLAVLGAHDQRMLRRPGAHSSGRYPYLAAQPAVRYDRLGARLAAARRPGDGRLFLADEAHVQYGTYLDWRYGDSQPRVVCRAGLPAARRLLPVAVGDPRTCLGGTTRLWIVRTGRHTDRPLHGLDRAVAAALRARYRVASAHYLGGCTLILTVRASAGAGHAGTG